MGRLLLIGGGVLVVGVAAALVLHEPLSRAAKSLVKSAARRSSTISDFIQVIREDLDDISAELAAERAQANAAAALAT